MICHGIKLFKIEYDIEGVMWSGIVAMPESKHREGLNYINSLVTKEAAGRKVMLTAISDIGTLRVLTPELEKELKVLLK
jgi:hypothetical protein